jgi:uncharacterized membrane protein YgcG
MRKEKVMPSSSAAKAKNKALYVPDAIVTITAGHPTPADVYIKPNGTVQFVNVDEVNWRVRLFTREHGEHADVDLFLPVRSSITVIAPESGECKYEVLEAAYLASVKLEAAMTGKRNGGGGAVQTGGGATGGGATGGGATGGATANAARGGGGGTIRIGPN